MHVNKSTAGEEDGPIMPKRFEDLLGNILKSNEVKRAIYDAYNDQKSNWFETPTIKDKSETLLDSFAEGKNLDALANVIDHIINERKDQLVYTTISYNKPIKDCPVSNNQEVRLEIRRFGPLYDFVRSPDPEFDEGFFCSLKDALDWLYFTMDAYVAQRSETEKRDFEYAINKTISSSLNGGSLVKIERGQVTRFWEICFKCKNNFEFGTAPSVRVDSEMFEFYQRWGNFYLCELEDRLGIIS